MYSFIYKMSKQSAYIEKNLYIYAHFGERGHDGAP